MKYITSLDDLGENAPYTLKKAVEEALKKGPCYAFRVVGVRPDDVEWLVFSATPQKRYAYIANEVGFWRASWHGCMEDTIVVTRHPALVEYLKELGLADDNTPVIPHATADDVRGKNVIGSVPMRLACEANSVTEFSLDIPTDLRGVGLDLQTLKRYAGPAVIYKVTRFGYHPTTLPG